MANIIRIGACLPRLRLERRAMAQAMGWLVPGAGAGRGTRTLAFWDEDSVTLAVAAARGALGGDSAESLTFATTTPPYAEPQNAALIRAALRLPALCLTQDATGTPRATLLALQAALERDAPALIAAADRPVAPAGSTAESRMGDGGAAVLTGPGEGFSPIWAAPVSARPSCTGPAPAAPRPRSTGRSAGSARRAIRRRSRPPSPRR
ncbi:hypothetical protein [Pararhodobacter aggregans]